MRIPTIIQITAVEFEGSCDIFGLGDDGKVYHWTNEGEWILNVAPDKAVSK
jgi:hypothetical protein